MASSSRNVMMEMISITTTMASSRRTMNRVISVGDPDLGPRIERVAQTVAEDVDRHHAQHEHDARDQDVVERRRDRPGPVGDAVPPGRVRAVEPATPRG